MPHDPWAARLSSTKHVGPPFLGSILTDNEYKNYFLPLPSKLRLELARQLKYVGDAKGQTDRQTDRLCFTYRTVHFTLSAALLRDGAALGY